MEENESRGRRRQRAFTDEYKADVVAICRKGDRSVKAVAQDLGLPVSTVHQWVKVAEEGTAERSSLSSDERDELHRLRKENRVLKEERDILKRAMSFFAKETR